MSIAGQALSARTVSERYRNEQFAGGHFRQRSAASESFTKRLLHSAP